MTDHIVFGPIRKQRRIVADRHRTAGTSRHAPDLERLHQAAAYNALLDGNFTIYLARGWGQIHGATTALQAILDAYGDRVRIVDEWARPMREFPTPTIQLPIITPTMYVDQPRPTSTQGSTT